MYSPLAPGSGTVTFDSMSPVTLNNGTGFVVYEVVDANPNVQESAQFPTYLGLAPNGSATASVTSETVSLAPVSTVLEATAKDPIPRFVALTPPSDCSIIGDCGAAYYPQLYVNTTPINLTAPSNGNTQSGYTEVNNRGGGHLVWTATVSLYQRIRLAAALSRQRNRQHHHSRGCVAGKSCAGNVPGVTDHICRTQRLRFSPDHVCGYGRGHYSGFTDGFERRQRRVLRGWAGCSRIHRLAVGRRSLGKESRRDLWWVARANSVRQ